MISNACFRVTADEVASDLPQYLELAKTRTFEIWHEGEVAVMLVRIEAIPEWSKSLQRSMRTELLTNSELQRWLENSRPTAEELANNRWNWEEDKRK